MRSATGRRTLETVMCLAVAALTIGLVGTPAHATPAAPETSAAERQLADYIAQGRPVADSGSACTSGSGAGSGNGSGNCYGGSGSSSGLTGSHASDTEGYGPQATSFVTAFAYSASHPDVAPPGTNDWACKPSPEHPRPVVLVHGTWLNAYDGFAFMSKPLTDAGFCTFTFNYGQANLTEGGGVGSVLPGADGTGYIQDSSKQLAAFVDRVLAATGTTKVDLIAHSLGGPLSRWYTKFDGGAGKVDHMITFGATHHGTSLAGVGAIGRAVNNLGIDVLGFGELFLGHAGAQQIIGSDFVNQLNAGGDTESGIEYTVVATRYDEATNPIDLTYLRAGPGATVQNILLQDGCEQDLSDHFAMMYSPRALSIALRALDPARFPQLQCTSNPWLIG